MGTCVVCGNEYARSFDVLFEGGILTFDSFECAIHRLAPNCTHCDCRIIGHGVEVEGAMYCCAHCARDSGAIGAVDHPSA
jgi:Zn finger protein HypA/HybF involved in hydrogenase expression